MCLPEIGITNTLPRAGAGEQGRAAIGRRVAQRQIRMFAESPPASQGCSLGAATPPPRTHRCKVTAWLGAVLVVLGDATVLPLLFFNSFAMFRPAFFV